MKNAVLASGVDRISFNVNAENYDENTSFWITRHQSLNHSELDADTDIVICITLYNESYNDLIQSLVSISKNIKYLKTQQPLVGRVKVCVIADGRDKLSNSVVQGLQDTGLPLSELYCHSDEEALHVTSMPISLEINNDFMLQNLNQLSLQNSFDLLFCTKSKNLGKLDSHWWFFTKFCHYFSPQYCFQMDTGTVLAPQALAETIKTMRCDESHAAVASNVLIEPSHPGNLLACYQCTDFIFQRGILWPAENIWGYLSVIPGQFCGMHWPSLNHDPGDGNGSPLSRYLKGMNCETAREKIMFLAEDRVMGFELMANKGSYNRLSYATDAECYTDACETVGELLEQRRRWINSAFVCRSWSMANMGRYWRDSGAPLGKKIQTLGSFTSMLWSHLFDWLLPLIVLLILSTTGSSLDQLVRHAGANPAWSTAGMLAITVLWLMPTLLALTGILQEQSRASVQRIIALSAATTGVILIIGIYPSLFIDMGNSNTNLDALFIPLFSALILLSSLILHRNAFKLFSKTFVQYLLCCLPVSIMLNSYAFTHMSDSSWGTKGLQKKREKLAEQEKKLQQRLNRFGTLFCCVWLSSNILIYSAIDLLNADSIVLKATGKALLFYSIFGLVSLIWLRFRQSHKTLRHVKKECDKFTQPVDSVNLKRSAHSKDFPEPEN